MRNSDIARRAGFVEADVEARDRGGTHGGDGLRPGWVFKVLDK
jgi:hypothetical protein